MTAKNIFDSVVGVTAVQAVRARNFALTGEGEPGAWCIPERRNRRSGIQRAAQDRLTGCLRETCIQNFVG
jgi:hypothetical protein